MHNPRPSDIGHSAGDLTAGEVTCQQFVELITDYFEEALDPSTLSQVEEHLVMCDWCVTYAEQMQSTVAGLRGLRQPGSPAPPVAALAALRSKQRDGR